MGEHKALAAGLLGVTDICLFIFFCNKVIQECQEHCYGTRIEMETIFSLLQRELDIIAKSMRQIC